MNDEATPDAPESDYPLGPALEFLQQLWMLNHALEKLSARMESTLGVTAQQRFLLRVVSRYPGIGAGQLARLLHVDPGTVSAALARLESKSLLERRRDPRDKRRAALSLTRAGRALDQPLDGTVEDAVASWLRTLPPDELATTLRALGELTRSFDRQKPAVSEASASKASASRETAAK